MLEFLSWYNFFYLVGILLGGYLTIVASKYKRIVKEVQDVSNALEKAYEDGKLTKKEKEILNNYNKLFKIDESRNNLNTGRVVEPKPNLDYYDNLNTMEDNYDNN